MNSALIQLLVLAGIAVFLILRLKNVLGTRSGFEKPSSIQLPSPDRVGRTRHDFEVIEGGGDSDITDYVEDGSASAKALGAMKMAEPGFNVGEFVEGAKGAHEMILMEFEKGNMEAIRPFLSEDVSEAFDEVVNARLDRGLSIEASFIGLRDLSIESVTFDRTSRVAEVTVKFISELTSVVKDAEGAVVEGSPDEIKRQKDIWTFSRVMGSDNPNWQLVATEH
ncbi:MAG: Tim44/TimA family putative adaptor protein [Pseudomonadota bacterium]